MLPTRMTMLMDGGWKSKKMQRCNCCDDVGVKKEETLRGRGQALVWGQRWNGAMPVQSRFLVWLFARIELTQCEERTSSHG